MRRSPIVVTALSITASAFLMACAGGASGGGGGGAATLTIRASEFKFEGVPPQLKAGQTYKVTVTNSGTVEHEFAIMPRGEKDHSKALVHVEAKDLQPGKSATVEVTIQKAGDYEVACHLPAHYESGMHTNLTVS